MILCKRYPVHFGVNIFERVFIILGLFFVQPALAALNNEQCVPHEVNVTVEIFSLDNYQGGWFNLTCDNGTGPLNLSLLDNAKPYFNIVETSTSISGQYRLIPNRSTASSLWTYIMVKNESMSIMNLIPFYITVKNTIRTAQVFPVNEPFIINEKLPVGTRIAEFLIQSEYNFIPHAIGLPDDFTITSNEDKIYVQMKSILNLDTIRQREICGCEQSRSKCPYNMTCFESDVIYDFSFKVFEENEATKVRVTVKDVNDMAPVCTITTPKIASQALEGPEVFDLNTICKDEDYSITNLHYSIGKTNCTDYLQILSNGSIRMVGHQHSNQTSCTLIGIVSDGKFDTYVWPILGFQVCPADTEQKWESGYSGQYMYKPCPRDSKGSIKRFCSTEGVYEDPIYNCTAIAIHNILNNVNKDGANTTEALDDLTEATSPTGNTSLGLGDIEAVTKTVSKISEAINTSSPDFRHEADVNKDGANTTEALDDLSEAILPTGNTSLYLGDIEAVTKTMSKISDAINTLSSDFRHEADMKKGAESREENVDQLTEKFWGRNIETHIKPSLFQVCPADIDNTEQKWESGYSGQYMYKPCPRDYIGTIKRFCSTDGVYEDPIYNCTAIAIHNILNNVNEDGANTTEALDDLSKATSSTGNTSLGLGDIETVTKILSKINDVINTSSSDFRHDADKYLEVASNLLQEVTTSTWKTSLKQTNVGAESVVENIDLFTEKVASKNIEIEVTKPSLYLKIGQASHCKSILQFPSWGNKDEVPEWAKGLHNEARIPCLNDGNYRSYSGVLYKNISNVVYLNFGNGSEDHEINAPIVSFSLYPKPNRTLDKPIEIKFGLYNKSFGDPTCSYWSETKRTWSSEGCWVDQHNTVDNTVTCKCDHLTNFAILMSPMYRASGVHHEALSIITLIGCIFSMVCIFLTVIMYVMFWHYVQSVRAIIHINISCSLFVAYLVFITGIDQTQNYVLCKSVAILLHLILLLSFFTMMVEGLNLSYKVLKPTSTRKPGIPFLIGAYILAFIVVGISLASRYDDYGGEQFCWLSFDHGSIWAFLGPAIFVCSLNVLLIIAVLWKMFGTAAISKRSGSEKARTALRNIAVLMPTMGLSWILGIFAVNEDTVMFQYLFAIANSLQGLLIFVLHVVLNKKIKEAVMNRFTRWQSSRSVSATSGKPTFTAKFYTTSSV